MYIARSRSSERGSYLLFFLAGLLPLLIFLFGLALDVNQYFKAEQRLQEIGDRATLLAWRALPNQEIAKQAVTSYINSEKVKLSSLRIGVVPGNKYNDEYEVVLEQNYKPTLLSYFNQSVYFPIKAVSRSRIKSNDIFIALDRSFYVAENDISSAVMAFPIDPFFDNKIPFQPFFDSSSEKLVETRPAQFMSQLCFNPFFSSLKALTIGLYEYFAAFGRNGLGIGLYPGIIDTSMFVVRPLALPESGPAGEALPLQIGSNLADQDYYFYQGAALGASSWCAFASENSTLVENRFPYPDFGFKKIWKPTEVLDSSELVTYSAEQGYYFDESNRNNVRVSEVVWSAVAKNQVSDFSNILKQITSSLLISGIDSSVREGLSGEETKIAVVVSADIPRFFATRNLDWLAIETAFRPIVRFLNNNPSLKFRMIYVVLDDLDRPDAGKYMNLEMEVNQLSDIFRDIEATFDDRRRLKLDIVYSRDQESAKQQILSSILLSEDRRVLSY